MRINKIKHINKKNEHQVLKQTLFSALILFISPTFRVKIQNKNWTRVIASKAKYYRLHTLLIHI